MYVYRATDISIAHDKETSAWIEHTLEVADPAYLQSPERQLPVVSFFERPGKIYDQKTSGFMVPVYDVV